MSQTSEQTVCLVILRPSDEYKATNQGNTAMTAVTDILNNRSNTPIDVKISKSV
jgi:hypothetical protein